MGSGGGFPRLVGREAVYFYFFFILPHELLIFFLPFVPTSLPALLLSKRSVSTVSQVTLGSPFLLSIVIFRPHPLRCVPSPELFRFEVVG